MKSKNSKFNVDGIETEAGLKALHEADVKYKNLIQNLNEGFLHARIKTDKNGKAIDWQYLSVNKAYEKLHGVKTGELVGKYVS